MAVDFTKLRLEITEAVVIAVNGTLTAGLLKAEHDVPVRKVFRGGKTTVRFKTASEIESDKELRSKLGLAPEILATAEALSRVSASGRNPKKSILHGGKEFGFARTISHPSRDPRRSTRGATDTLSGLTQAELREQGHSAAEIRRHLQTHGSGKTRAERGLVENRSNRANAYQPFGEDIRLTTEGRDGSNRLSNEGYESQLTGRGRYELKSGRAIAQRRREIATVKIEKGKVTVTGTEFVSVGQSRLGGGLRSTLRIVRASASQYPVIEGWLVAGDAEHDYAKYQELGTRHNPAHPFLRPRLPEWREELPEQLRRALGRVGR